jgi:hypothetical protein
VVRVRSAADRKNREPPPRPFWPLPARGPPGAGGGPGAPPGGNAGTGYGGGPAYDSGAGYGGGAGYGAPGYGAAAASAHWHDWMLSEMGVLYREEASPPVLRWGLVEQHVHRSQRAQAGQTRAAALSAVAAAAPVALVGPAAAAAAIGAAAAAAAAPAPAPVADMVVGARCLWSRLPLSLCRTTAHGSRDARLVPSAVWLE